jgi:hypothetical protein
MPAYPARAVADTLALLASYGRVRSRQAPLLIFLKADQDKSRLIMTECFCQTMQTDYDRSDFLQNFLDGFPKKDLTTAIFSGERTQRSRILPERNSQK